MLFRSEMVAENTLSLSLRPRGALPHCPSRPSKEQDALALGSTLSPVCVPSLRPACFLLATNSPGTTLRRRLCGDRYNIHRPRRAAWISYSDQSVRIFGSGCTTVLTRRGDRLVPKIPLWACVILTSADVLLILLIFSSCTLPPRLCRRRRC